MTFLRLIGDILFPGNNHLKQTIHSPQSPIHLRLIRHRFDASAGCEATWNVNERRGIVRVQTSIAVQLVGGRFVG